MISRLIADAQSDPVKLTMAYNRGNQLTSMKGPSGQVSYAYDDNGNMTEKALTGKALSGTGIDRLVDFYAYDGLDRLVSYVGYDGYSQEYTIGAHGLRQSMREKGGEGSGTRLTLEEMLRESMPLMPRLDEATSGAGLDAAEELTLNGWTQTSYIHDVMQGFGQVIHEESENGKTSYVYGRGRISATETALASYAPEGIMPIDAFPDSSLKTTYVYNVHGSVVQSITGQLPATSPEEIKVQAGMAATVAGIPQVQSYAYTPYGEMMSVSSAGEGIRTTDKQTGYGYSGEWYDANTGMQNLRARQYEPAMARFSQKDIIRGSEIKPITLNRYSYTWNDPVNLVDPNGLYPGVHGSSQASYHEFHAEMAAQKQAKKKAQDSKKAAESAYQVAAAANAGFEASQNSTNPIVQAAIEATLRMIAEGANPMTSTLSLPASALL